jgi:ferrous iron transport protein A
MKPLSSFELGKKLVVDKLLPSDIQSKLLEMGLYEGKEISIIYKAPLGDPIAVQVGDYVLSMRLQEASLILVNEN